MVELVVLDRSGSLPPVGSVGEHQRAIAEMTRGFYERVGYQPPWTGYWALRDGVNVGTCGFKGPPSSGIVEIAYHTFPEFEGQGIANAMADALVGLAQSADPALRIIAHTLPEENRSTAILRRRGFTCIGPVDDPEDGIVWRWELLQH